MAIGKKLVKKPYGSSVNDIAKELNSDIAQGLTQSEALTRNELWGLNIYQSRKQKTIASIIIDQFKGLMVYLLAFGAAISFYFHEEAESIAIVAVILINAIIGFLMEFQARESMKALKKMDVSFTKVIRDGELQEIGSEKVTIGDIVFLEAGDVVPADGRIFEVNELECDESSLTGESLPVEKSIAPLIDETSLGDQINMAFKGTSVVRGNGKLIVTGIGLDTELGHITSLVETSEVTVTPLDKKLNDLTKRLVWVTIFIAGIFLVTGFIQGKPVAVVLETAIALAVAAIPEGLPIVSTIALAYGMLMMARRKAIVKKLSAVETLGGTSVILTDKTGTLTENKIVANSLVFDNKIFEIDSENKNDETFHSQEIKQNYEWMILISALCNNAAIHTISGEEREVGDPLEVALIRFVEAAKYSIQEIKKSYPRQAEEPFSSETKIMATLHQHSDKFVGMSKGSVEHLLLKCKYILQKNVPVLLSETVKSEILENSEKLASKGLRVLGFGYNENTAIPKKSFSDDLIFIGMIGFLDPPRLEVKPAMQSCREAGIKVVMVTGDHPKTALNIAQKVSLINDNNALVTLGSELPENSDYPDDLRKKVLKTSVFARVTPRQKLDLVSVYQQKGFIVAMTGDGVNDAPAIKKADIGIAMGQRGTQVAKETADIVLKDDSFSSIVAAIAFGRGIFRNIQKFVIYLISCNLSEILIVTLLGFIFPESTLLPLQILFINMVTDVFPALALGMGKSADFLLDAPPRSPNLPIITIKAWRLIIFYSLVISFTVFGGAVAGTYYFHLDAGSCNNLVFFSLALSQLWHVFNMSSSHSPFIKNEITTNGYVWIALFLCFGIVSIINLFPLLREVLNLHVLSLRIWAISTVLSLIPLVVIQSVKRLLKF